MVLRTRVQTVMPLPDGATTESTALLSADLLEDIRDNSLDSSVELMAIDAQLIAANSTLTTINTHETSIDTKLTTTNTTLGSSNTLLIDIDLHEISIDSKLSSLATINTTLADIDTHEASIDTKLNTLTTINSFLSDIDTHQVSADTKLSNLVSILAKVTSIETLITALNTLTAAIHKSQYQYVAASQTNTILGTTGAIGDTIKSILLIPGSDTPGAVSITDDSGTARTIFIGGKIGFIPVPIPLGIKSTAGAWKITTGVNVSCIVSGNFT